MENEKDGRYSRKQNNISFIYEFKTLNFNYQFLPQDFFFIFFITLNVFHSGGLMEWALVIFLTMRHFSRKADDSVEYLS